MVAHFSREAVPEGCRASHENYLGDHATWNEVQCSLSGKDNCSTTSALCNFCSQTCQRFLQEKTRPHGTTGGSIRRSKLLSTVITCNSLPSLDYVHNKQPNFPAYSTSPVPTFSFPASWLLPTTAMQPSSHHDILSNLSTSAFFNSFSAENTECDSHLVLVFCQ